jgi:hypothetical protein
MRRAGQPKNALHLLACRPASVAFILATILLVLYFGKAPFDGRSRDPLPSLPKLMLWAWERPENLEFLDPSETGVAFLAITITLPDDLVIARPRMQPMKLPPGCRLMAVVRIETSRSRPLKGTANQRTEAVRQIAELAQIPDVSALQIDFDATESERPFYRDLLSDLRQQVSQPMKISITALASWCLYDDWISGLPIDEAVPMLFRMGTEDRQVRRYLAAGRDFRSQLCRCSVGISTDEPPPALPSGRRIYIFHPRPWTDRPYTGFLRQAKSWQ